MIKYRRKIPLFLFLDEFVVNSQIKIFVAIPLRRWTREKKHGKEACLIHVDLLSCLIAHLFDWIWNSFYCNIPFTWPMPRFTQDNSSVLKWVIEIQFIPSIVGLLDGWQEFLSFMYVFSHKRNCVMCVCHVV